MKFLLAAVATLAAAAPVAAEPIQRVDDPTPNDQFSGTYDCSYYKRDAQGNQVKVEKTCSQTGYVAIYQDGVVACNGNENLKRPDNNEPLQGYIWVGSAHAAKDRTGSDPTGNVGAGNNTAADDRTTEADEAHGPCEDPPQRP